MGIQLRVSLPDQPGALARVTQAIAACRRRRHLGRGARVRGRPRDRRLPGALAGRQGSRTRWSRRCRRCPGVDVLGCRRTRWLLDGRPDLDLLTYLIAVPDRGCETLVDMAPAALDADWAELRPPARRLPALYPSAAAAHDDLAPESMPVRARPAHDDAGAWAYLPVTALHSVLVIGRDGGPGFLRSELAHAERVVDLAMRTLESVLGRPPTLDGANELTAAIQLHEPA